MGVSAGMGKSIKFTANSAVLDHVLVRDNTASFEDIVSFEDICFF